jgi:hypothetical protein
MLGFAAIPVMSSPELRTDVSAIKSRSLSFFALLLIVALYIVGIVSHGVVRHIVQTAPVWPTAVLGMRSSLWTKWTALPCFFFWLFLMGLIWLFLLGWAHIVSGSFTTIEIAMTLVVGFCSAAGLVVALKMKTGIRATSALAVFLGILILQLMAFRISLLPAIAHDSWR